MAMNTLEWVLFGVTALCAGGLGWLFRHSLLLRHLTQNRTRQSQFEELQLSLQNENASLREQLVLFDEKKKSLDEATVQLKTYRAALLDKKKSEDALTQKLDTLQQKLEDNRKQIVHFESENRSLSSKIQQLVAEKKTMGMRIHDMESEIAALRKALTADTNEPSIIDTNTTTLRTITLPVNPSDTQSEHHTNITPDAVRISRKDSSSLSSSPDHSMKTQPEKANLATKSNKSQDRATDKYRKKTSKHHRKSTGIIELEKFEEEFRRKNP